ncbi:hypothetical protein BDV27DRAFT_39675 [Aspergillus caelatus]|uniref:Uncharacterized protein n=1 Tax=Aspergillus caelatus TaxID=61420 RepID=A0A5N6ZSC0_9EURO|nr:uncharacterized protein BDV27DRAFT_39675 [Aspergillus caelatus]KAE8360517.1 hypothetical protein BDV27DRAFT_39675 [Aspergillus caelatus]
MESFLSWFSIFYPSIYFSFSFFLIPEGCACLFYFIFFFRRGFLSASFKYRLAWLGPFHWPGFLCASCFKVKSCWSQHYLHIICAKVLDILSHLEIFLSYFVSSVSPFPLLIHLSLCI